MSQHDKEQGPGASSAEFFEYDQVEKPNYHLAETADVSDDFDDDFEFKTCNIERFLNGNEEDRAIFAQELGEAMESIGFAILHGHGVDPQLFADANGWVEDLFTKSSLAEKMQFRAERHEAVSEGYFPIKETSGIHPDLVEGWVFGRRAFNLDADSTFDAAGFWPRPELEPCFRRLIEAELPLLHPIMQSVLRYLNCDPDSFSERLAKPHFGQRLNYYPPLTREDVASGSGRLLGHEDVDLFTLLPAPTVEGLQVLHRSGKWVRLHAPAGSIILNTGDYLQRISNDILRSTTHRVSPPRQPEFVGLKRISFPLAAYIAPHEMLEVLPGLPNPRYEPIRAITFHTRTTAKFYGDGYAVED